MKKHTNEHLIYGTSEIRRSSSKHWTYIRGFGLSIPAVTGIVGHLIVHVLTETKLVFRHTNFDQIKVDPSNEVAQDGVVDDALHNTKVCYYN